MLKAQDHEPKSLKSIKRSNFLCKIMNKSTQEQERKQMMQLRSYGHRSMCSTRELEGGNNGAPLGI